MRNAILLLALSFFAVSCYHTIDKPKHLVEKDKMITTLVQIYLHQQSAYMNEVPSSEWNPTENDAQLITAQGLDIQQFTESYRYYVLNPDDFTEILKGIEAELEKHLPEEDRLKRMENKKELEKNKK